MTTDHREVLMQLYRAFNERDIEGATEFLAPEVEWPNLRTGDHERGRAAVRAHWEKLWKETDTLIKPLQIEIIGGDKARVRVHELVRALDGAIIEDRKAEHMFTFDGAFISRMVFLAIEDEPEDDDDDGDFGGDDGGGE
ncbi:MAG: nuclear transport factor 2 family protein [Bauldia sp.]|uniref:nuclear transport factor 2 family protein n=1 Tax=Bauldia sp. TaxID=2575872 RepID=UPI001D51041E|nr:nuclear transport factor 2 family protein [Bauldia sp.]MCB1494842.1 nuclear transport factor 2 family protein [Bauldia sp.]